VSPGQYFVLKLNFSEIRPSLDPKEAHENLVEFFNSSLETFYGTYAGYLGGKSTCSWGRDNPNVSFQSCADAVRCAIQQDERLGCIKGIYVLVDEYDAFPSNYLGPPKKVEEPKIAWDDTAFDRTLRAFWAAMKSLCTDGIIKRTFITGTSPLSLSSLGNAFDVTRNLSFHRDLAGLCGLTSSDLENALEGIYDAAESSNGFLSEMSKNFDGYHFCKDETVQSVYNTETCLAYLQCRVERIQPDIKDPKDSEASEQFLRRVVASASVVTYLENALLCNKKGQFVTLRYGQFKSELTLRDLVCQYPILAPIPFYANSYPFENEVGDNCSWLTLLVYLGCLTFHPEKPTMHLKIPNRVVADRIALAVLEKYGLMNSFRIALRRLLDDGDIAGTLGCYRDLMMQRDITVRDLTRKSEIHHRDYFYFCFLRNRHLIPCEELQITNVSDSFTTISLTTSNDPRSQIEPMVVSIFSSRFPGG
jgi:hypothetical protein